MVDVCRVIPYGDGSIDIQGCVVIPINWIAMHTLLANLVVEDLNSYAKSNKISMRIVGDIILSLDENPNPDSFGLFDWLVYNTREHEVSGVERIGRNPYEITFCKKERRIPIRYAPCFLKDDGKMAFTCKNFVTEKEYNDVINRCFGKPLGMSIDTLNPIFGTPKLTRIRVKNLAEQVQLAEPKPRQRKSILERAKDGDFDRFFSQKN